MLPYLCVGGCMKKVKKLKNKLSFTHIIIATLFIAGALFLLSISNRGTEWTTVTLKISPEEWWWNTQQPEYWLADTYKIGASAYNSWGTKEAEIIDLEVLEDRGTLKSALLTLRLLTKRNNKQHLIMFRNKPLSVGSYLVINSEDVIISGLVTSVNKKRSKLQEKIIEITITGEDLWVADSINIGDVGTNSKLEPIVEILSKKVETASNTLLLENNVPIYLRNNPNLVDITLTIKIMVNEEDGLLIYREGQVIKVDEKLYLQFPHINLADVRVTKIIK